jgi:hypothetical protein
MRDWTARPKVSKTLSPELLSQPNIPKPLHGINPRTIMGEAAWRIHRQVVVTNSPYCKACGKETLQLDLHEDYVINYKKKLMTLKSYVPVCRQCHMFIHSGFLLTMYKQQKISREQVINILTNGINILDHHSLPIFIGTYSFAKALKLDTKDLKTSNPGNTTWDGWRMLYKGKEYKGLSKQQWVEKYGNKKI